MFTPSAPPLQTRTKKFKKDWIVPLQVKAVLDKSHYLLADWHGKQLPFFGAVHRLKACYLHLGQVQNKVLTTLSNIQGLKKELEEFEPSWKYLCIYS